MKREKILVITKNWLGDVVFESPAIKTIKKRFPDSELVCAAPLRCHAILKNYPYIDRVIAFDEKGSERSLFSKLKCALDWRREHFTRTFLFHRSQTRALLTWGAGIPYRAGYATKNRAFLLTHPVEPPTEKLHDTDYYLHLLQKLGITCELGMPYEFFCSQSDEEVALRLIGGRKLERQNYIVFHTGANWEPKRWSGENFLKLCELIQKVKNIPILLTGAADDADRIQALVKSAESCGLMMRSLAGETTLGELGAVFKFSKAVVSNDSGPLHMASGIGTPTVALFGPTNEVKTGPRGRGKSMLIKRPQMSEIRPEEVLEALRRLGVL